MHRSLTLLLLLVGAVACASPYHSGSHVTGAGGLVVEQSSLHATDHGQRLALRLLDPAGLSAARSTVVVSSVAADGSLVELARGRIDRIALSHVPYDRSRHATAVVELATPLPAEVIVELRPGR